ncbi:hypothetical protein COO60DRAFT_1681187 [Scenedesmus sp. NREL 46B-D3]|nr:hypothetical protein COO60DRAFT_1681187 [Scenedesmus sp. NREL 46B-D3]
MEASAGLDFDARIRDTDLDTLERLVACLTWGDIEVEDSHHLAEASFVKVFRLAQLLLEYLLYVQDSLKHTNSVLELSRARSLQHVHALNSRCRELQGQLKQCKQELRRARKTVKTLELVATAVSNGAATATPMTVAGAGAAINVPMQGPGQQQQQQAVPVMLAGSQHVLSMQQQGGSLMYLTAGELLLQSQMTELAERLAVAGSEADRLRQEREELCYQQQHQEEQQLLLMEVGKLEAQVQQMQTENAELRQQLMHKLAVDFTATNEVTASLQAQLDGKIRELLQLQGELRQSETSMAVFKQANDTLKQQLDALQRQLNSPEAATPSFVAKQRTRLAAAENKAEQAEARAQQLQVANMQLAKHEETLQAQLLGAGMQQDMLPDSRKAAALAEDYVVEAAEQLLSGTTTAAAASEVAAQQCSSIKQQDVASASAEWKLAEIERLQLDNRLLHAKVTSLQEQLHDLERLNARLERQAAKSRHIGLAAFPECGARSGTPSPLGQQQHLAAAMAVWTGESLNSSGPREELTAADLAAARGPRPASPGGDDHTEGHHEDEQGQQRRTAAGPAAGEQNKESTSISVTLAAAIVNQEGSRRSSSPAGLVKGLLQRFSSKGKAQAATEHVEASEAADAGDSTLIPAFRPDEPAGSAAPKVQEDASTKHGGTICKEAAQQLKALVAAATEKPAEQLAADYDKAFYDWKKPYELLPEEDAQFGALLPLQMPGRPGLLMASQHDQQELAANQGRLLACINMQLDAEVASFGIHPGRKGLSSQEVVAAMSMLSERRQAFESSLPEEQGALVDIMRVGLILNCYNTLQGAQPGQTPSADGKLHLPGPVAPALVSDVQPPASLLPVGPPSARAAAGTATHSMAGAHSHRGMLQSTIIDANLPAASSRYQNATAAQDSDDDAGSPQRHPHNNYAATGSTSKPHIGAALLQAISPLSAGPLSCGPAGMAGSHVTSRTASYTAATHRAGAAGAFRAFRLARAGVGTTAAASAVRLNQQEQQQHRGGASVLVAAAVTKRDYLNNSFNDSDEF